MKFTPHQADAITSAVWLVGIGVLITTGWWWPGIMFLIGLGSIAQGFVEGRAWYASQTGLWSIGIGIWALTSFNILALFVVIAVSGLVGAFSKPPAFREKPEPDHSLYDDGI